MKQHLNLTVLTLCFSLCACCLLAMPSCATQHNADGELTFYADAATNENGTLDSSVLSLERGSCDETSATYVLCLNATAQPNESCEWVTYESTSSNVQVGSAPGAWGNSVTVPAQKAAKGFFLYCNVTAESLPFSDASAFQAFADSELKVTFEGNSSSTSYYYSITPTSDYLSALNAERNPGEPRNSYHGPRFTVQKRIA